VSGYGVRVVRLNRDTLPLELALLSPEERERAARFRFETDRRRFIACRAAVRRLLGAELGRPPESLTFVYGPHGKPALSGETSLRFNVAHSGPLALLALTDGIELGVDIEAIRPDLATSEVAATVFTGAERAQLLGPNRVDRFFQLWTRKEAYLKAIGEGFASPILEIPAGWLLEDLPIDHGYRAALAYPGATRLPFRVSWYPDRQ
jgi:4'-phosphopantetheinyl transferase